MFQSSWPRVIEIGMPLAPFHETVSECLATWVKHVALNYGRLLPSPYLEQVLGLLDRWNNGDAMYACRHIILSEWHLGNVARLEQSLLRKEGDDWWQDYFSLMTAYVDFIGTNGELLSVACRNVQKVLPQAQLGANDLGSALLFVNHLIHQAAEHPERLAVVSVLQQWMPVLMPLALQQVLLTLPITLLSDVSNMLQRAARLQMGFVTSLLQQWLAALPSSKFTDSERALWMDQLTQALHPSRPKVFKQTLSAIVQSFRRRQ